MSAFNALVLTLSLCIFVAGCQRGYEHEPLRSIPDLQNQNSFLLDIAQSRISFSVPGGYDLRDPFKSEYVLNEQSFLVHGLASRDLRLGMLSYYSAPGMAGAGFEFSVYVYRGMDIADRNSQNEADIFFWGEEKLKELPDHSISTFISDDRRSWRCYVLGFSPRSSGVISLESGVGVSVHHDSTTNAMAGEHCYTVLDNEHLLTMHVVYSPRAGVGGYLEYRRLFAKIVSSVTIEGKNP